MSQSDVLDRRALDTLLGSVGGDREFLAELVDEYLDDSPRQFVTMRKALADGDCEALRRAAHSLKSNSATFGATKLSTMCRELEYKARDGELAGGSERISQAEAEFETVQIALKSVAEG
jgi:HPt (histidine-containing phosphotransfer) domain-containing protein